MHCYSWFRRSAQSETDCDCDPVDPSASSGGVATIGTTATAATPMGSTAVDFDTSPSVMNVDLAAQIMSRPSGKSALLREDDISSTQDESDISSTFWFRVVDDKSKLRRIAAEAQAKTVEAVEAEQDFTCCSIASEDRRVIPFVSLNLRMDYPEHSDDDDSDDDNDNDNHREHSHTNRSRKDGDGKGGTDSCSGITELLARQKDQELFYGDLLQRIEQNKGTHGDEVLSLPDDLEVDDDEDDETFQVEEPTLDTTEKEALESAVPRSRITADEDVAVKKQNEPLDFSGPTPVSPPPRAPIPKLISFDSSVIDSCSVSWKDTLNEYQTEDTSCSNTACNSSNDNDNNYISEEEEAREEIFILDPVDPLVYGSIDYPYLKKSSDKLYQLLKDHLLHLGDEDEENDDDHHHHHDMAARDLIQAYPETCQVRYHPPAFGGAVYPLSYFCATGHLLNIQAAYTAYPEAIGQEDPWVGTPLHYACYHNTGIQVVEYLVQKFPEAVRVTNYSHQTPVHMACMSNQISLPVVELLLEHYPTAAQLADQDGYTPFHLACLHGAKTELLQLLMQTSPSVIRMSTRALQKALHVACLHAPITETVELLLRRDPSCVRATDEFFQTPLHCAVQGKACQQILTLLVKAHPGALYLTNDFDETPYRMAERLEAPAEVLALLKT
jgi:hypothetical protein